MNVFNKWTGAAAVCLAGVLMATAASATAIPAGWTCNGNCGTDGADGVVTLPPNGNNSYQWISTSQGNVDIGALPTGKLGHEQNGSTLATSAFSASAGTNLNFYFNFVTSDGAGSDKVYADYGWAALIDTSNNMAILLFTARAEPNGDTVPGQGMPPLAPGVTLTPGSTPIIGGPSAPPQWSPLGPDSTGTCYGSGCGYTGWVNANYTIAAAGNFYLEFGVTNWLDDEYDTGLAMSGVTVGGNPVGTPVPEPAELGMFGLGLLLIGTFVGLRRRTN